jgi:hypothetical protein
MGIPVTRHVVFSRSFACPAAVGVRWRPFISSFFGIGSCSFKVERILSLALVKCYRFKIFLGHIAFIRRRFNLRFVFFLFIFLGDFFIVRSDFAFL